MALLILSNSGICQEGAGRRRLGLASSRRLLHPHAWCLYWEASTRWGWNSWNFLGSSLSLLYVFVGFPGSLISMVAELLTQQIRDRENTRQKQKFLLGPRLRSHTASVSPLSFGPGNYRSLPRLQGREQRSHLLMDKHQCDISRRAWRMGHILVQLSLEIQPIPLGPIP